MKKFNLTTALAMLIFLLASCHTNKPATSTVKPASAGSEVLYQHRWNLEELNGKSVSAMQVKIAHLLFSPGLVNRVSGNTGCNNFNGNFELSGNNNIKFQPLAVTKMACLGENTETAFLEMLKQVNSWSINNDHLILSNGKITLAKFKAVDASTAGADPSLLNGTWEMNYISGPRIAFEGLYPNKKPTLIINIDKTEVSGNTSCNGFSSIIKTDGATINIAEPIAMTMMACGGEGEKVFLDMLKKVNRYAVSGDILNLLIDDVAVMRFAKK